MIGYKCNNASCHLAGTHLYSCLQAEIERLHAEAGRNKAAAAVDHEEIVRLRGALNHALETCRDFPATIGRADLERQLIAALARKP